MIGSFWVAVMLYGTLLLVVIDLFRVCNIRPEFIYANLPLSKAIMFGAVCVALSVILVAGYRHAHRPKPTFVEMAVDKKAGDLTKLRLAMVSDIHLGHLHGRKKLARIINAINEQQPDLVLFVGDILDGSPTPFIQKDMGVEFARLHPQYGAYIIAGNHEYFGERTMRNALKSTLDYLASYGVQPLLDSVVFINSSFYVAGRKDRSVRARKTLPDLLRDIDPQLPIIIADHQPYHLNEAEEAGVDLQLSGHTHHGQLWPINYITRKIYELDWGFLRKGKTNYYVSCGVGTWGPPVRTAGYSEVVVIDMIFN